MFFGTPYCPIRSLLPGACPIRWKPTTKRGMSELWRSSWSPWSWIEWMNEWTNLLAIFYTESHRVNYEWKKFLRESKLWIRIRRIHMFSGLLDPDPLVTSTDPAKRWKFCLFFNFFGSAGCSLLRAEGFSCSLGVLYGGLGISKLQFLIKKIKIKFLVVNFFRF
jgi:hypothetical protein